MNNKMPYTAELLVNFIAIMTLYSQRSYFKSKCNEYSFLPKGQKSKLNRQRGSSSRISKILITFLNIYFFQFLIILKCTCRHTSSEKKFRFAEQQFADFPHGNLISFPRLLLLGIVCVRRHGIVKSFFQTVFRSFAVGNKRLKARLPEKAGRKC